jgi:hypothetical protein
MRIFTIAGAAAAALVATAAQALVPTTGSYDISLVVSGSSALEPTFAKEFGNICQAGTLDNYTASGSPAPAMAAFSCTTVPGAPLTDATIENKNVIVYYRFEGGSAYGVAPIAKSTQVYRLVVDASCTGATPTWTCPVTGWNFAAESGSGNITLATTQLGISDVEPNKFVGANWPGGFFGAAPNAAQLALITSVRPIIAQVFAVYVSTNVSASNINLTRAALTEIMEGSVADWSSVPKGDNTGFVSAGLPLVQCNRDNGSGTRAGAGFYFTEYGCGGPGLGNVGGLAVNASTGTEVACIGTPPAGKGAIGYAAYQGATNPAGTSLVLINGIQPNVKNAAAGQYDYYFEATANSGASLSGLPSNLATAIVNRLRDAANVPATNNNALALSDFNTPVVPVVDAVRPVSTTSHNGNSCNNTASVF